MTDREDGRDREVQDGRPERVHRSARTNWEGMMIVGVLLLVFMIPLAVGAFFLSHEKHQENTRPYSLIEHRVKTIWHK